MYDPASQQRGATGTSHNPARHNRDTKRQHHLHVHTPHTSGIYQLQDDRKPRASTTDCSAHMARSKALPPRQPHTSHLSALVAIRGVCQIHHFPLKVHTLNLSVFFLFICFLFFHFCFLCCW